MEYVILAATIACALAAVALMFRNVVGPKSATSTNATVQEKRPSFWERLAAASLNDKWGRVNPVLVCPHCQQKGSVRTKPVDRSKGVSGGKAIGAILTGGISLLATGISREERLTQAHCDLCTSTWDF